MDSSGDRLAVINDELRGQAAEQTPWLPLESNPDIFSAFGHQIGMPLRWRFVDVLGLDPELLAMAAGPDEAVEEGGSGGGGGRGSSRTGGSTKVAAVILLFPCSEAIYGSRAAEDRQLQAGGAVPEPRLAQAEVGIGDA